MRELFVPSEEDVSDSASSFPNSGDEYILSHIDSLYPVCLIGCPRETAGQGWGTISAVGRQLLFVKLADANGKHSHDLTDSKPSFHGNY